ARALVGVEGAEDAGGLRLLQEELLREVLVHVVRVALHLEEAGLVLRLLVAHLAAGALGRLAAAAVGLVVEARHLAQPRRQLLVPGLGRGGGERREAADVEAVRRERERIGRDREEDDEEG